MSGLKTPVSGHGGALPALSPADLAPDREGEPRVLDLALAERLGFDRPNTIRDLIRRNRAELEGYGTLVEVDGVTGGLPRAAANPGGRPGRAFLLTEDQAVLS